MKTVEEILQEEKSRKDLNLQEYKVEKRHQSVLEALNKPNGINLLPKFFMGLIDAIRNIKIEVPKTQVNISPNFKVPESKVKVEVADPKVTVNYTPPEVKVPAIKVPTIKVPKPDMPVINIPEVEVSNRNWDELETKFNKSGDLVGVEEVYPEGTVNYKKIAGRWYRNEK